jgi:hypothetical protein
MGSFVATDEQRKAAKEHLCITCKQEIPKGAAYHFSSGRGDDHWWTWHEHLPCHDVTQDWLHDEPDGLYPGDYGKYDVAEVLGNSKPEEREAALVYFRDLGLTVMVEAIEKASRQAVPA